MNRSTIREIAFGIITLMLLLLVSGNWTWIQAWLYSLSIILYKVLNAIILERKNPGLLESRGELALKEVIPFDKYFIIFFQPVYIIAVIVAAFDAGKRYSIESTWWIMAIGIGLYVVSGILATKAMAANQFFAATVRIQDTQEVCKSGPYGIIRHPGYTAGIIGLASFPVALVSPWSTIPILVLIILFIIRTKIEDDFLQEKLDGYQQYTKEVSRRLIPGIW